MPLIGIDLGGTKIEVARLDDDGTLSQRIRADTPAGDYRGTLNAIGELVDQLDTPGPVGICTPGALSPASGLLRNANSTCLNGQPLLQDLQTHLARPVRIANDADCFALSEATDGAAAGAASVFGIIAGTGTGGGVVVNGRLLSGPNAIAGEWGHNPLPWPQDEERPGPDCYCGKQGCIETWLAGPSVAADHLRTFGDAIKAPQIVAAAEQGDHNCQLTLAKYEDRLARALATIINVIDPDVIVLGGGMSNINRLYDNVPELWNQYVFSDHVATELRPPKHGDSSGVRGAAWLWGH